MNKVLSIMTPYVMIVFVGGMHFLSFDYQMIMETFIMGLFIAVWMNACFKTEGTVHMRLMSFLNVIVWIGLIVMGILFREDILLNKLCLVSLLLLPIQLTNCYIIVKNKSRLSMSYKYSFKNRRKRYF